MSASRVAVPKQEKPCDRLPRRDVPACQLVARRVGASRESLVVCFGHDLKASALPAVPRD
jgi:hypothetical protein